MPMRWRRMIDLVGFISAVALAARLKFELHYSWPAAICSAVIIAMPFIVSRVWTKYTFLRTERAATEMKMRQRWHSMLSAEA
jgi:ABC-type molybdate transport system permease subunit